MLAIIFTLLLASAFCAEFTLPGECPNVKIQDNLDYTKFSGLWYNVGSYASDGRNIYDCASLEFQEDNLGYTLRETYVDPENGNRTQKSYFARVDPTFDAGTKAQFIVSHEDGDKVLQFPFFILSTDYDNYAIAYTCKTLKKKMRTHYGQVLQFGTCPEVESMKYFEMEKFLGTWFEAQRFPTWYEDYGHCAFKTFEYCGRRMEMTHGYVRDGIEYILHVNTTYAPGDEAVFTIPENNIDPIGIPLIVIDTDYKSYALIYGCKSNEEINLKYLSSWILSRTPSIDADILSKVQKTLVDATKSSAVYFETIHHNNELCSSHWTAHVHARYYSNETVLLDDLD